MRNTSKGSSGGRCLRRAATSMWCVCTGTQVHYEQSAVRCACTGTRVHYEQAVRGRVQGPAPDPPQHQHGSAVLELRPPLVPQLPRHPQRRGFAAEIQKRVIGQMSLKYPYIEIPIEIILDRGTYRTNSRLLEGATSRYQSNSPKPHLHVRHVRKAHLAVQVGSHSSGPPYLTCSFYNLLRAGMVHIRAVRAGRSVGGDIAVNSQAPIISLADMPAP